ncbi:hypothetical protein K435DRAFT_774470 [Dendrothele bispora CBS 962.96]|uniref:Transmembrane protein n=1 Tax=Dendrothele bispora (strain CBS 962.96) TaxID=1314807 RepID=A0A4V4HHX3_DENBC|nr:hypothetical protein K435DRAFT_774470 [Dendrothele bispora CBS 962.96]
MLSFTIGPVLLGVVLFSPSKALAQTSTSTASCTDPTFANANPCEVAAKVGQICISSFTIPAINPSQSYGAQPGQPNQISCTCTTIYFSLLSLCSYCQDVGFITPWQDFTSGCASVFTESGFPVTLPSDLAVPDWAFLPLLANGSVNAPAIIADQKPDRVNNSTSVSTPQPSSPVQTQIQTPAPTPTTASSPRSNRKRDAAIIAGSVVGGLALLLSVAIGFWYWLTRLQRESLKEVEDKKPHSLAVPVPFEVRRPVDPLPEKGSNSSSRLSQQPSQSSLRGSWLESDDGTRCLTVTSEPDVRSSTHGTHLSVLSTQHQHQIAHGPPMIIVQGQNTETSFSTEPESRDEVHELRTQVNMLTTEVCRLSRETAPPAYN